MGPADRSPGPLARAPREPLVAVGLEAGKRAAGTGRGPRSRRSPCRLLVASGGATKSLGQGRSPTARPSENGPGAGSLGPAPLDWAEMRGAQPRPPTALPTGEAYLPRVWGGDPRPAAVPVGATPPPPPLPHAGPPSPSLTSGPQLVLPGGPHFCPCTHGEVGFGDGRLVSRWWCHLGQTLPGPPEGLSAWKSLQVSSPPTLPSLFLGL